MVLRNFLEGFGGEAIKSPFQDGHYIYTVIAGAGSGTGSIAPIIFVADLNLRHLFGKNYNRKITNQRAHQVHKPKDKN